MDENCINYPITLEYRATWNEWHAIRELVQNALDADPNFTIEQNSSGTILKNNKVAIKKVHFLFGVSEKDETKAQRGQFGEGGKLAVLVLKRLGYDVEIKSSAGFKAIFDIWKFHGKDCLKLTFIPDYSLKEGTEIWIKDYHGETFSDRFIRNGNKTILFTKQYYPGCNLQILNERPARLYVSDIYVQDLENGAFSYNFPVKRKDDSFGIEIDEGRNIASEWHVRYYIGVLWHYVDEPGLLRCLMEALKAKTYEYHAYFRQSSNHPNVVKQAFHDTFGDNAVLRTDEEWERRARHRHAKPIDLPTEIHPFLKESIITDKDFVIAHDSAQERLVPDSELSTKELDNLNWCRNLANEVDAKYPINAYIIPNHAGNYSDGQIRLSQKILKNRHQTTSTFLEELAHAVSGADDKTVALLDAIKDLSAQLLLKCWWND